jgi:hypothetical protein
MLASTCVSLEASASIGCIWVYFPQPPLGPCGENGCGVGCGEGDYTYLYNYKRYDCDTGEDVDLAHLQCLDGGHGRTEWHNANLPIANPPAQCNNPWSAIFIDCGTPPEPKQCRVPLNDARSAVGDPIDLTTGGLEQTPTDLDLGRGLAFRRHYASDQDATTSMGVGWQHSLDWRLRYKRPSQSAPGARDRGPPAR